MAARAVPAPAPKLPRLHLFNPHTGESFNGPYRDATGPIPGAMHELSEFLRDFHCGATIAMDVRVLDFLAAVLAAVGDSRAEILSAYRTPATNAMLARTMFGVAEHSQHMYGRALDIHVEKLAAAMAAARAMKRGGVGWYPQSHFIHIDCGPVRNWDLDEKNLNRLLLFDPGPMQIGPDGELLVSRRGRVRGFPVARRPLSVAERLRLHRELARAEFLARQQR
ncbi:MAG: YcbK family protein [Stellaceae bacterium]